MGEIQDIRTTLVSKYGDAGWRNMFWEMNTLDYSQYVQRIFGTTKVSSAFQMAMDYVLKQHIDQMMKKLETELYYGPSWNK